jgi:four helix bundle protein
MAKRVEDLIVWQLADALKTQVYALTDNPRIRRDFKFYDQITDAASSSTRNIGEGFGRYRHREFAQMVSIARASVIEIWDLLLDGVKRRHWTKEECAPAVHLCFRAAKAMARFIVYLKNTPDPPGTH